MVRKANLETKTWVYPSAQTEKAMKKIDKWQFCSQDLTFGILLHVQTSKVFMANCSTSIQDPSSLLFTNLSFSDVELQLQSSTPTNLEPSHFVPTTDLMQHVPPPYLFLLQTRGWSLHFSIVTLWQTCFFIRNVSAVSLAWVCWCSLSYLWSTTCSITEQKIPALFSQ